MSSRTERALLVAFFFGSSIFIVLGSPTNRIEHDPNPPAFSELLNLRPPVGPIAPDTEPEPTIPIVISTEMPTFIERTWSHYAVMIGSGSLCLVALFVLYILHRGMAAHIAKNRRELHQERMELHRKRQIEEQTIEIE